VVKYAAVVRQKRPNGRIFLRIKAATTDGTNLAKLLPEQLSALTAYIDRIADAGVDIEVDSQDAEQLKLSLTIYYNPLILGANGSRLDGTDPSPVPNAIRAYLQNLPFNGLFVLAHLVDALQKVEGVEIPNLLSCSMSKGELGFFSVDVEDVPDSGYIRIDDDSLDISYLPHNQII
jgi:hypothetical protein